MVESPDVRRLIGDTGSAMAERTFTLPAARSSAGEARRRLREALAQAQREQWQDEAELALSEVATNAVLHAHTVIEIQISVFDSCVFVAVSDLDPTPPVARHYSAEAITGRGLDLVARITAKSGVHRTPTGKVVWFSVGDEERADQSAEGLLAAWDIEDWDLTPVENEGATRTVVLQGLPPGLWLAVREHHDAILRDLSNVASEAERDELDLDMVDRARSIISATLVTAIGESAAADPSGMDPIDLRIVVPADAAPLYGRMQDVLDHAETLAIKGKLLVRPALPEVVAVRDWACEQVIAQLAGVAPTPWAGTEQERFETEVRSSERAADWDPGVVDRSERAVVAADDANRIVAVSDSFLALVGWERDELIGRRVVTLIPPAMREAHVAGFTRHLSTGEVRVLDNPTDLPVLHHDGHELTCRLLIQRELVSDNRSIFIAWAEPTT
jgi:PAS domain S-box-containing protein